MKIIITLDLQYPLETTDTQIKQLLQDALREFIHERMPNMHYVQHKYPSYTWEQMKVKRREVTNRCNIADRLCDSDMNVIINN